MFSFVLIAILGYLLGSFPTAYLLVQWKSKIDIRNAGSGNVGTLNSAQVTNSKLVGFVVLVVDVLKGSAAVILARSVGGDQFWAGATGGLAAVVGHNFPIWLGFKGGRGLATAAGVMFVISWGLVAVWGVLWAIGFPIWKNVNVANAFASLVIALAVTIAPEPALRLLLPPGMPVPGLRAFCVFLMVLVLAKHVGPVKSYLKHRQLKDSIA